MNSKKSRLQQEKRKMRRKIRQLQPEKKKAKRPRCGWRWRYSFSHSRHPWGGACHDSSRELWWRTSVLEVWDGEAPVVWRGFGWEAAQHSSEGSTSAIKEWWWSVNYVENRRGAFSNFLFRYSSCMHILEYLFWNHQTSSIHSRKMSTHHQTYTRHLIIKYHT
jgi:hypothetical protein